jgi:hypothetical protein
MASDEVKDPISGETYVVSWNGSRGSASLIGTDPRYTRQRPGATDHYTQNAVGPLGFRPTDVKCEVKVDWPW